MTGLHLTSRAPTDIDEIYRCSIGQWGSASPTSTSAIWRRRFGGFELALGWSEFADKQGLVAMRALPTDTVLRVRYRAPGYQGGERTGVMAGPAAKPTRLELRLSKE